MPSENEPQQRSWSLLRFTGSLWFAAVLLILLLVALAAATVFESAHSPEQALRHFYGTKWFEGLLFLLGVNVLSAMIVRYPFSRRQIGFLLTHASILIVLLGALVTKHLAIDGQIVLADGQTTKDFTLAGHESLHLANTASGAAATADLPAKNLALDKVQIQIVRSLADSATVTDVLNDNPHLSPAVEVSLSESGKDHPLWIFADTPDETLANVIRFRRAADVAEFERLQKTAPASQPASNGTVRVEYKGITFTTPLESALNQGVKITGTDLTLRILRYMPHAVVGQGNQITNASANPENPAIEAEISGPAGTEKRLAFSRFPEFSSMHKRKAVFEGLNLTFVRAAETGPEVPVDIVAGPGGKFAVRLRHDVPGAAWGPITPGQPLDTPWPNQKFAILRYFEHARKVSTIKPVAVAGANPQPALELEIAADNQTLPILLQKNIPQNLAAGDQTYRLAYTDKLVPLGFALTLDRFRVGFYPGERQPRSFESHVTIKESDTGQIRSQVISMNNPLVYGGYSFYQSSYNQDDGKSVSILSVSRDPGQPIVFAGYFGLMGGMVLVLITKRRQETK